MNLLPSFLTFLLHSTILVSSEPCPAPEDIVPCSCRTDLGSRPVVSCRSGSLTQIKNALKAMKGREQLQIEFINLRLGSVPSLFFWGLHVDLITFENCELEGIADEGHSSFIGLEDSLRWLTIRNSFKGVNELTDLKLDHLKQLTGVNIYSNNIVQLDNDWFQKGPVSLTSLHVEDNAIRVLDDRSFESLTNLKSLWLNGNRFRTVRRSMLPRPARDLSFLSFQRNAITSLPDDMFADMPALKYVYFTSNDIQHLLSSAWTPVWRQLDTLNLDGNPLECDSGISWMFRIRIPRVFSGTCEGPKDKKGLKIKDVIKKGATSRYIRIIKQKLKIN